MAFNESQITMFNRMLANTSASDVQKRWWVQDAPLEVVANPLGPSCHVKRGCLASLPAFVRCDSTASANRKAVSRLQWPLCGRLLEPLKSNHAGSAPIAFSFGINNEWQWDDHMAGLGFDVHSFDPTLKTLAAHQQHQVAGVKFHYVGLTGTSGDPMAGTQAFLNSSTRAPRSGRATQATKRSVPFYGNLGGEMLNWGSILGRVGHNPAVVKIDCEGCEWEALAWLAERSPALLGGVRMLLLEVHLSTRVLRTVADLRRLEVVFSYLFQVQGFRIFYLHANWGWTPRNQHLMPDMVRLGAKHNVCCYEMGLVR